MEQATTSARVVSVTKEQGGVALIHLNRPPANSYDRQFIDDLNAAIDEIRFDEAIGAAVLMSDLPKFFSAGDDDPAHARSPAQDGAHAKSVHRRHRRPLPGRRTGDFTGCRFPICGGGR